MVIIDLSMGIVIAFIMGIITIIIDSKKVKKVLVWITVIFIGFIISLVAIFSIESYYKSNHVVGTTVEEKNS